MSSNDDEHRDFASTPSPGRSTQSSSSVDLDDTTGSEERSNDDSESNPFSDVVDGDSDTSSDTDSESYYDSSATPPIGSAAIDSLMDALRELKKNDGYIDYGFPWSPDSYVICWFEISQH
jgi:hypothetical protein